MAVDAPLPFFFFFQFDTLTGFLVRLKGLLVKFNAGKDVFLLLFLV